MENSKYSAVNFSKPHNIVFYMGMRRSARVICCSNSSYHDYRHLSFCSPQNINYKRSCSDFLDYHKHTLWAALLHHMYNTMHSNHMPKNILSLLSEVSSCSILIASNLTICRLKRVVCSTSLVIFCALVKSRIIDSFRASLNHTAAMYKKQFDCCEDTSTIVTMKVLVQL